MAFKECKNKKNAFKLGLVYFAVLIGAKSSVAVNLKYLHLVKLKDRLNSFAWDSIFFEQFHDNLSFVAL